MASAVNSQSRLAVAASCRRYLVRSIYSTTTSVPAHRIGRLRHSVHNIHHRAAPVSQLAVSQCSNTNTPWARLRSCTTLHNRPLVWTRGLHTVRPHRCSAARVGDTDKEQIITGVCFSDPPLVRNVFLLNSGKYTTLVHGEFNFDAVSHACITAWNMLHEPLSVPRLLTHVPAAKFCLIA